MGRPLAFANAHPVESLATSTDRDRSIQDGMPEGLFKTNSRTLHDQTKRLGLGLYTCQQMIRCMDGSIGSIAR